jgi:uncharacterized protein YndB with AHSA1/START domain
VDIELQQRFITLWNEHFPGAELPLALYYTDQAGRAEPPPSGGPQCLICALARARRGIPLRLDGDTVRCGGGKRYLGFTQELRPTFRYFLSCGIPGELEGERYKKTPELVEEWLRKAPPLEAPAPYIVFKRWDTLTAEDEPAVVVFFATPDVLAGLFTLANYEESDPHGVIAPMGSGCSSIVYHPLQEARSTHPSAVLGMFDVSARPCVPAGTLTMAIPWAKFIRMVGNAAESFLITASWQKVAARIASGAPPHAERAVQGEVVVEAPIADVWAAWTTPAGVRSFFAPACKIDLRVGGAYEMYFDLEATSGQRGGEGMRILALQPPAMLSFTWNAPPSLPEVRGQQTMVVVRLEEIGANLTQVRLTHSGWGSGGEWDLAIAYFERAWKQVVLPRLQRRFASGPLDWEQA